jgi:hypothetical protein
MLSPKMNVAGSGEYLNHTYSHSGNLNLKHFSASF